MKTKTILLGIGLLFAFQSFAQATLKNGKSWDFRGTYVYTDLDGKYTLDVFGSEGSYEADLKFEGPEENFKMTCDGEWDEVKKMAFSYVKIWDGSSSKEAAFKADKVLLKLVIDGNDCKTEIGSLKLGGFEKGFTEIMFIKESSAGEGPP
jgi:hypothetical protein